MDGTPASPGTIVCTVTGHTRHPGVGEVAMGTSLREVLDVLGGGPLPGQRIRAVLPGVSNAFIPEDRLDVAISYEGFAAIGSGLGSAGFIVYDGTDDLTAVVAGVSRFLAVESCGQCVPCKQDGLVLADLLAKLCRSQASAPDFETIRRRAESVTYGARCSFATQQQTIVNSLCERFRDEVDAHVVGHADPVEPDLVAELVAIDGERALVDEHHRQKQPDWTYASQWSGSSPAELHAEHRANEIPREVN